MERCIPFQYRYAQQKTLTCPPASGDRRADVNAFARPISRILFRETSISTPIYNDREVPRTPSWTVGLLTASSHGGITSRASQPARLLLRDSLPSNQKSRPGKSKSTSQACRGHHPVVSDPIRFTLPRESQLDRRLLSSHLLIKDISYELSHRRFAISLDGLTKSLLRSSLPAIVRRQPRGFHLHNRKHWQVIINKCPSNQIPATRILRSRSALLFFLLVQCGMSDIWHM
ncbi:hypothetical protein HDV57DRAFT_458388 [Trichoderma longibrachiatum]